MSTQNDFAEAREVLAAKEPKSAAPPLAVDEPFIDSKALHPGIQVLNPERQRFPFAQTYTLCLQAAETLEARVIFARRRDMTLAAGKWGAWLCWGISFMGPGVVELASCTCWLACRSLQVRARSCKLLWQCRISGKA